MILFLRREVIELRTKIFLLIIFLGICNVTFAQSKISTIFFLNNEIFDQFEKSDGIEITLKEFSAAKCRLNIKNNLDTKFRPRVKISFSENWGNRRQEIKNLPEIGSGQSASLDIEMKNYSVTRRKKTSAWLQIWLDGDKLISEGANTSTWQKISLDGDKTTFNEHYWCVKFDFLIADNEVEK